MKTLLIILGLFGASTDTPYPDGTSLIVKQVYNKVYDEKRVQTVETFIQKYPPDFVDKTRILE
jgi:hypothetical protein